MVTSGGYQKKYDLDLALKQFCSCAHNKTKQNERIIVTFPPREQAGGLEEL